MAKSRRTPSSWAPAKLMALVISAIAGVAPALAVNSPMEARSICVLLREQGREASIWVKCGFSAKEDLLLNLGRKPIENFLVNSYDTQLIASSSKLSEVAVPQGEVVHSNGDDSTPWHINGVYIGGNHGCPGVLELSVPDERLAAADIGSSWRDEAGVTFFIIDVPSPGTARVLSENVATYPFWKFHDRVTGTTLTSTSGNSTFSYTKATPIQLLPCARIKEQKFLANGKTPLKPGKVIECDFLEIVEDYDIINPAAVLNHVIQHPGKKPDYVGSQLDAVINNKIVHRIHPNAATVITHRATALQPFNLEFMGFIQQELLGKIATSPGLIRYYIPKAEPFQQDGTKYDFRSVQDFSTAPQSPLKFTGDDSPASRALPERFVQFLGDPGSAKNENRLGFALGYSLTNGLTALQNPSWRRKSAGFIHTTSKTYPFALDESVQNPVAVGTVFECVAYRQYFNPAVQSNATCAFWHRENDKTIVYVDYHKPVDGDVVHLPQALVGRPFRIIEKIGSLGVESTGSIPREGLKIRSEGAHGSLVLEVSD